jgi:formate hydrogenlyase subunit 3/multisubunit Na+/H+ antiporter MnhD subunit
MSAPLIWMIFPGFIAVVLLFASRWHKITTLVGSLISGFLFGLAILLPIVQEINLGSLSFQINDTLLIFGRQVIVQQQDLALLAILYFGMTLWISGNFLAGAPTIFPAMALGIAALLVAAISVQPFLYAAVFIELVALGSIPLLSQGMDARIGVLRLLTFYTLGMPAILFVGWMLTESGVSTPGSTQLSQVTLLVLTGFMFFLAVFPVHSWVPIILEKSPAYNAAFVVFWLLLTALFFGHGLLVRLDWLANTPVLWEVLKVTGLFLVVVNGLFLYFQTNLKRILAFAILSEIGFIVLALSQLPVAGSQLFYALIAQYVMPVALWSFSLANLSNQFLWFSTTESLTLSRPSPWLIHGIALSQFCILGLPLLPLFPLKIAVLDNLRGESAIFFFWLAVGIGGSLVAALRTLYSLLRLTPGEKTADPKSIWVKIPIISSTLILFLLGILPGVIISIFLRLVA